ncbi:hypothetical protein [Photobacterium damselae]|uniref:hypothetical protein n=1 Tax=Photobacterium damselae TaxID=38293 RepID=UPI000D6612A9|nr:hypothetical protein [Photobacterium damselae]AWK83559.1 hypothetical protein BST98_16175 [Photobacterium damselae]
MVPVSDFLPTLRTMVDVPIYGLMERALIQAAIRFCRESQCLFKTRYFEEVYEYQQVSAVGGQLGDKGQPQLKGAGIIALLSDGHPLSPGADYDVIGLDNIVFKRQLSKVDIHAFAEPVLMANQLPTMLYLDYCHPLCAGAAATLQMQPNQTWTQPDLAQYNERLFIRGYREAFRCAVEQRQYRPRPEIKREFY